MECDKVRKGYKMIKMSGTISKVKGADMRYIGPAGLLLALTVLPVYGVSNALLEAAVLRNTEGTILEKKWAKGLAERWKKLAGGGVPGKARGGSSDDVFGGAGERKGRNDAGTSAERAGRGLGFVDFEQELTEGKQWFQNQKKERITMTSYDGLKLVAYYLPAKKETGRVLILMHGYRNEGLHDFAGLVKFYHEMGFSLLVPHQRSHGESEGEYICFGVKERYDLKKWTEYMVKRFQGKCSIFLNGISMGGATVLMAAGLGLPEEVKGIIADCAFTSPKAIFSSVLKDKCHLPEIPFLYVADRICRRKAGFRFNECSTIDCVKKNRIPILFIHGGKDEFVPTRMCYENYDACRSRKELLIVGGAAHGTSHLVEPEAYRSTVMEFIRKWEGDIQ